MKNILTIAILTTTLISSFGSSENKNAETTEQTISNNSPTVIPDFTKPTIAWSIIPAGIFTMGSPAT